MQFSTSPAPYPKSRPRLDQLMLKVSLALLPGLLALLWQFGWGVLYQIPLAVGTALVCEGVILLMRQRPVLPTLADGSAALTAILLALSLPPLAPWWVTVIGSAFAIVIAKQLYGGLGFNVFNPAMVAYAVLLVSFPKAMTTWSAPIGLTATHLDFMATGDLIFRHYLSNHPAFDALTAATPLDVFKTQWTLEKSPDFVARTPAIAEGWGWVNLGFFLGGMGLLRHKLIDWRIPVGFLGALFVTCLVAYLADPATYPTPLFQLSGGATLLGAFFIATDPVTAATTPKGRWIYAGGIGFLVAMIRLTGSYPDGVAFAVLLMNFAVPTLEHYTRPRVYGTHR